MENFKNKTILITGGTGSFGQCFVNTCLKKYCMLKKIKNEVQPRVL